jgi:hypothetical protein
MFCQNCGSSNDPRSRFCIKCGAKLNGTDADASAADGAPFGVTPPPTFKNRTDGTPNGAFNDGYNAPKPTFQNQGAQGSNPNDAPSCGIGLLCFIWPVIGLILYLVWRDTKPLAAKSAGMYALVSVIVRVAALLLYGLFIFWIAVNMHFVPYAPDGARFVFDAVIGARFAVG